MRKIVLLLICLVFTVLSAYCNPYYSSDIQNSGYGVVELTETTTIYQEPSETSEILEVLNLHEAEPNFSMMYEEKRSSYYFLAKTSDKNKAFLVVTDENDDGWFQVCYSQKENLYGWIKLPKESFKTWKDFFNTYARQNGLYIFKDVPGEERKLYARPFEKNQDKVTVANYDHAYAIKLATIKGNWALVRVLDVNNSEKIGFLRWRTDDGKLLLFPKL